MYVRGTGKNEVRGRVEGEWGMGKWEGGRGWRRGRGKTE